jgi:hypothetical protein
MSQVAPQLTAEGALFVSQFRLPAALVFDDAKLWSVLAEYRFRRN